MENKKKDLKLRIPFGGKQALDRIFKILALSYNWKLQPRDFEVAVELYYKNYLLITEGITDESNRMEIIFSKINKEKVADTLKMSYNAVANSITHLRKSYFGPTPIVSEVTLNKHLQQINPSEENFHLLLTFNVDRSKQFKIVENGKVSK